MELSRVLSNIWPDSQLKRAGQRMEMKLNSKRIRELRLARSWTQEQLAEKARLNPRTIQRVEMEGQGSLRTRLQIANALGVNAVELDVQEEAPLHTASFSGWRGALQAYCAQTSLYALTVQLLVALLFLASAPAYFSASSAGFSWMDGQYLPQGLWWWVVNLGLWTLLSLPLLLLVRRHHRQWLPRLGAALLLTLCLAILRLWQQALVADLLILAVFLAGLVLLVCQWVPHWPVTAAMHLLYGSLFAYVFLWFFQGLAGYILGMIYSLKFTGSINAPLWYVGGLLLKLLGKLVPLLPVICVLLLAQGRSKAQGRSPAVLAAQDKSGRRENAAGEFHERRLLEY